MCFLIPNLRESYDSQAMNPVHQFQARSWSELVKELEAWLMARE